MDCRKTRSPISSTSSASRPLAERTAPSITPSNWCRPSRYSSASCIMRRNSDAPTSRRRSRSLVTAATVNPATSVPSRSKNAPMCGPSGLASTSATEPGSRSGRGAPSCGVAVMRCAGERPAAPSPMSSGADGLRRAARPRRRGRARARPPQLDHLVEAELQALLELVGGGERRRVVAERHRARARPGDEDRHHGHPGHGPHPVLPVHPRPGQERLLRVAGHVAGLDVRRRDPLDDPHQRLVGEQGQDRRELADHVDGRLAAARDHLLADLLHPLGRIGFAERRGHGDAREPVSRRRVVAGAQADRNGQRHGLDWHAEDLVVPAQAAAQRGEVGVVDRSADRLGRRAQVGERQLEHEGAGYQAPAAQQRRRLGRRRAEHAPRRVGEAKDLGHRGSRLRDQPGGGTHGPAQPVPAGRERRGRPLPEAVAEQVLAAQVARHRHRRHRPGLRFPLGVVDLLEQGERAQAVGDRVAELDQQRGAGPLLLPRRPSTYTASHRAREVSSGDCSVTSARSSSWRSVPGPGSATRRRW